MSPLVSLVTTVYNRSRFLAQTIDSILAQTYPHFELLIWDDGSTDNSVEIAQHYTRLDSRVRLIASPVNQGIPVSVKAAIAATSGQYLGLVDSDDLLAPTALEKTIAILDQSPHVGLVYTNYHLIDEQGRDCGLGKLCRTPYSKEQLLVDFMTFHFRLIRRVVYDQVSGIDDSLGAAEDYDLCLKLSEVTEVQHLDQTLYSYRRHSSNITRDRLNTIHWTQKVIRDALHRRGLDQRYEFEMRATAHFLLHPRLPTIGQPLSQEHPPIQTQTLAPIVSIVIPVYNVAPRIAACLDSCFQQTYPHLELIVVDNNSTDDSLAIVQQYAQASPYPIQIVQCPVQGANFARNAGFLQTRGDYIQWLDADDELEVDKLKAQVSALEKQPQYEIAYGDWEWHVYQQQHPILKFNYPSQQYTDFLLQLLLDNYRPPHTYLLRRSAAERLHHLQAWNPETPILMDREYFTLAALLRMRFLYVPGSRVHYYRWSATHVSLSGSYLDRVHSRRRMFQRFRDIALVSLGASLTPAHWQLLTQSWNLWKPAFLVIQQGTDTFWLQHSQTQATLPITGQQATISYALLQGMGVRTLEDHARKVVQLLWQETLRQQIAEPGTQFNYGQVAEGLATIVQGSKRDRENLEGSQQMEFDSLQVTLSAALMKAPIQTLPFVTEIPLFAPLFSQERFLVYRFLEQLGQQGWLAQVSPI
jgi:glycosyltransferase involved in cell wall biosynthesis